jgi:hypothetical protein
MVVEPVPPPPAEVLVAGRSAMATITQLVLVAVVWVSVIVPERTIGHLRHSLESSRRIVLDK